MLPRRRTGDGVVDSSEDTHADALLPWPQEWPAPRPKLWIRLTVGYLCVLTLLTGGLGFWALLSGQYRSAIFLFGGGVYLGLGTSLSLRLLRTRRHVSPTAITLGKTGSAKNGIVIAYSDWLYGCLAILVLLTLAALTGLALSGLAGWPVPPFSSAPGIVSTVVFSAAGLYFLWIVRDIASGRLARGRVVLSPDGIYHRSLTFEHFAPWHAVHTISAEDISGPLIVAKVSPSDHSQVRQTSRVGKQQEFKFLPHAAVRARSLKVDPAVLYHALRYYHAHPGARPELATDTGLRRIRTGDLLKV
jgi:hypothetical protein